MARAVLTAEKVRSVIEAARALEAAHLSRDATEKLATLPERVAFHGLLSEIGDAVVDGYEAPK